MKLSIISTTTINILICLFIYLFTYHLFSYLFIYLSIYQIIDLLENCTLPGYYTVSSGNNPEDRSSHLIMYLLSIYLSICLSVCLYLFILFVCWFNRSLDNNDHSSDSIHPLTVNNKLEKIWKHLTCFELQL